MIDLVALITIAGSALLFIALVLRSWARHLAAWESDLDLREAAIESARVARQEQLVEIERHAAGLRWLQAHGGREARA